MVADLTRKYKHFNDPRIHAILNPQAVPDPSYFDYYRCPIAHAEGNAPFYVLLTYEVRSSSPSSWPADQISDVIERLQVHQHTEASKRVLQLIEYYKYLFQLLTNSNYKVIQKE